jgi:hypothetical protein
MPEIMREIAKKQAFELIRYWTGIYNLDWKSCFDPKGDSVPPEWLANRYDEADNPEDNRFCVRCVLG